MITLKITERLARMILHELRLRGNDNLERLQSAKPGTIAYKHYLSLDDEISAIIKELERAIDKGEHTDNGQ